MAKCVICGKRTKAQKFPFGTLSLCHSRDCRDTFLLKIEQGLALVWVSPQDFVDHEVYPENQENPIEKMSPKEFSLLTDRMRDALWDDGLFGSSFHDVLKCGAVDMERSKIREAEKKNLPLLLGQIVFPENQKYLEERIKNG